MKKGEMESTNFQDVNDSFVEQMWELTPSDIRDLDTIVIWIFESTQNPTETYFFIKNWLFGSNHREKIDSNLRFGGRFKYIEEIDTGDKVEHDRDGELTSESWNKVFEKREELNSDYTGEFPS